MLTEFGKILRKMRIDSGEVTKDLADKLGCTVSYLSAVETGKRNIPEKWVEQIIALYALDNDAADKLRTAALAEAKSVKIDLTNLFGSKRETAILFARNFADADDDFAEAIRELLKKSRGEQC